MKIAVVGAGGVGGYFGACLVRGGADVTMIVTPRHVPAISRGGLRVTTDAEEFVTHPAVSASPQEVGPVDLVLTTVKLYQLDAAAQQFAPVVANRTLIVTLENGVTAGPRLASVFGARRVAPGLTTIVSELLEPGHVRQTGPRPGLTVAAWPSGDTGPHPEGSVDPRVAALVDAVKRGGGLARASENIDHDLWEKFALITTFGAVCGLAHATIGEARDYPPTRALFGQSLREVQAVAASQGVTLTEEDLARVMGKLDGMTPHATSSMQRDLADGRPSELTDLNGTVSALGQAAGVATPLQDIATAVLGLHAQRGHV